MAGDPEQCRLNAVHALSEVGRACERSDETPKSRHLGGTKLAAEIESDLALLNTLSKLELDQPFWVRLAEEDLRALHQLRHGGKK